MKNYKVTITEILEKTVEIEANSRNEAMDLVKTDWKDCIHTLD